MKLLKFLTCIVQFYLCLGNPNRPLSHEEFFDDHEGITSFIGDLADLKMPAQETTSEDTDTLEDIVEDISERRSGSHPLFENDDIFHCKHPKDINCRMPEHCVAPNDCSTSTKAKIEGNVNQTFKRS